MYSMLSDNQCDQMNVLHKVTTVTTDLDGFQIIQKYKVVLKSSAQLITMLLKDQ